MPPNTLGEGEGVREVPEAEESALSRVKIPAAGFTPWRRLGFEWEEANIVELVGGAAPAVG